MNNREFEIRARIDAAMEIKQRFTEHYDRLMTVLSSSFYLTFLLYLAFTVSLYLGDVMQIRTLFSSWGEVVGFGFYMIIATLLAFVLAKIKHLTYVHGSMFGNSIIIVGMLVVTGIVFESFQTAAQQDMKARKAAENSTEVKAAVNADPLANLNTTINTDKLAFYEGKLAEHQRYKEGCVKTCAAQDAAIRNYTAKIKVEQDNINRTTSLTKDLAAIGTTAKQDAIDRAERKGYNLMARAFADMSGTTIAQGVAFLMILVSTLFEAMHFWASLMLAKVLRSLEDIEGQLMRFYIDYQNETGREWGSVVAASEPVAKDEIQPIPPKTADKPAFGFQPSTPSTQPATASAMASDQPQVISKVDAPLFKYQTREAQPVAKAFGFAGGVSAPVAAEAVNIPRVRGTRTHDTQDLPEPITQKTRDTSELYADWVAAVQGGEIRAVAKESRRFIQRRLSGDQSGKESLTMRQCGVISKTFMLKALRDGVLVKNTSTARNQPMYLLKGEQ